MAKSKPEIQRVRTVRQFLVTVRSTIVPDNPIGDEFVNDKLDSRIMGEVKYLVDINLPVGYHASVRDAGTNKEVGMPRLARMLDHADEGQ